MRNHIFLLMLLVLALPVVAEEVETEVALKLFVFDCGQLKFDSIEAFSIKDDETDIRILAVPCYVIEHPKGRLLWDGGLPTSVADEEGWQSEGMQMRLDRSFSSRLEDIDLDMSSFDFVAFSHMHFDHIGVANEVTDATLIIQNTEFDAAFAPEVTNPGFDKTYYGELEKLKRITIEGDHDVFGDGSVEILSAPGHTPGHQVLFIDLPQTGPIVLSGDLYHFAKSRTDRRVPSFNSDAEQSLQSMDRIEALLIERKAELWIEHELATFAKLKQSPEFYQ